MEAVNGGEWASDKFEYRAVMRVIPSVLFTVFFSGEKNRFLEYTHIAFHVAVMPVICRSHVFTLEARMTQATRG